MLKSVNFDLGHNTQQQAQMPPNFPQPQMSSNFQQQMQSNFQHSQMQTSNFQQSQIPTSSLQYQLMNQFPNQPMVVGGVQSCQHSFKPMDPTMELVDRMIEKYFAQDNTFPGLVDKMRITCETGPTVSGLHETDYPNPRDLPVQVSVNQLKIINKVAIPPEILEQIGHANPETPMGLFTDINRAWLAAGNDIYMWNYETGDDVLYYDGVGEPIRGLGLITPRPELFQDILGKLLVIATDNQINIVGIVLVQVPNKKSDELQLTGEVLYTLSTDRIVMKEIKGTKKGRLFLGGYDGCLYEISYQKKGKCKKINHSRGLFSYVTGFLLSFSDIDPIVKIEIDESRHILYTLTSKGSIDVWDLGKSGTDSLFKVASLPYTSIRSQATMITQQYFHQRRDLPDISHIHCICALEESDSPHLGIVGITLTGVRLYFSTGSPPPLRPSTLRLLHVRYPPGLNPNSPPFARDTLTVPAHKAGVFIMATSNSATVQDKIWCLSSDLFPNRVYFSEDVQFHNLCSSVISIGESNTNMKVSEVSPTNGHILVYQHNIIPNKFVLLTCHGTETYEKLRPVDIMVEILRERNGPDNDEVKQYFFELGTDQACAMALIIACNFPDQIELTEWATRAFFLYGGDPKHVIQPMLQYPQQTLPDPRISSPHLDNTHLAIPPTFKPGMVSTPVSDKNPPNPRATGIVNITSPQPTETFTVQMSSKHNGLYLYLSRVLRLLWSDKVVKDVLMQDNKNYFVSSTHINDLDTVTAKLLNLKMFLQKNAIQTPTDQNMTANRDLDMLSPSNYRIRLQDAITQERTSLEAYKSFVDHAAQVFGLWKIICQHQFHIIADTLTKEAKAQLGASTFRDLVLCGKELCGLLINSLINLYLNDNASVDSISAKLRKVCPSLYKSEDATCSKVNEILTLVKDIQDEEQKMLMLRTAINLSKEVSVNINHSSICKQLVGHKYYDGVIEVCRDAANKADPLNFAKSFLEKNQPADDQYGCKQYLIRINIYKELVYMLDQIHHSTLTTFNQNDNEESAVINQNVNNVILKNTLIKCLSVDDEVAHMVVYEWLVSRKMHGSLVALGRPSIEKFLANFPPESELRDLMWQYHESAGDHSKAAQILYKLATGRGDAIKLQQRLTYLGKAVMCMRSDGVGCAPHLGVFLHELEDLVQVTRVQKQVLDRITGLLNTHAFAEDAVKKLNSNLLSLTELFEDFAEPFNLWDCKLTILNCAGHDDAAFIQSIWDEIIKSELDQCTSSSAEEQMLCVASKVKTLGMQLTIQSPCFPIYYLIWQLELLSCRLNTHKARIYNTMLSLGVPVMFLLDIYDKMHTADDSNKCWADEGNELHLIQVIASFADYFIKNPNIVQHHERRAVADQMQGLITNCSTTLFTKRDCHQLLSYLEQLKNNLARIN